MENATKALLIAASVLIAIMLITMGVAIYQIGNRATEKITLDETTIMAHNNKFTSYEGTNVRGTRVNTLLETVLNHNQTTEDEGLQVTVYNAEYKEGSNPSDSDKLIGPGDDSLSGKKVDTGKTYTVTCIRDKSSGVINSIYVKQNGATKE